MQRRIYLGSTVLSLGLILGLVFSGGPVTAAGAIQPGARISSAGKGCTVNFIYRELLPEPDQSVSLREDPDGDMRGSTSEDPGSDTSESSETTETTVAEEPALYAGTAGHCVARVGDRVRNADGEFGTVAFFVLDDDDDFAFIEIDRAKEHLVNPTMLGFDGPNGVISGDEAQPGDAAHVYGNGLVFGESELTRPRSGSLTRSDSQHFGAILPVIFGDSGGPVLHEDGSALGIVAHMTVATDFTTLDGNTVERALSVAAANGLSLEVVPG